ncbi:MAG: S8 family peptidase [Desulfobulbaceae bacterium]
MMPRSVAQIIALLFTLALFLGIDGNFARAQVVDAVLAASLQGNAKLMHAEEILAPFSNGEPDTAVIVILRSSAVAEALAARSRLASQVPAEFNVPGGPPFYNLRDRAVRGQLRATVTETVAAAVARLAGDGLEITHQFSYQFGFAARATPAALQRIVDDPEVVAVERVRILQAHLAQGIPLMNGSAPRADFDGAGLSIAICDTGIDTSHPRLGGTGSPADPMFNAKVIGGIDTGDSDADPRPNSVNGQAHGTACAGIAAGNTGTVNDYIGGVAPGAKLYAVKISSGTSGFATDVAMIAGWEWVITHQDDDPDNPIMVISTSFGGGQYLTPAQCDWLDYPTNSVADPMAVAAANAVAAGITVFASSGNDGYCNAMGWPACISHVNSVGAVYDASMGTYGFCVSAASCATKEEWGACSTGFAAFDATAGDKVTSYSNSASFLTLFAPSNDAYTTDIVGSGGYDAGDYDSGFGGTSAACPYAAGAAAVLQSANKSMYGAFLSPSQVRQYLVANGDTIADSKPSGISKPRVNLGRAVNKLLPVLTVTKTGRGTVTSSPAGINCGSDCTESYPMDTPVTLTANAYLGAPFLGWAGEGCSGTGPCDVLMDRKRNVAATFDSYPWTMFLPAISGGEPAPVSTDAYWTADNDVCCDNSSATFSFTLAGVTRSSSLADCAGPSSLEGWVATTAGAKTFIWEWLSSGCDSYMGSFSYTLRQGIYHLFALGWNGSSFTMTVTTQSSAFSAKEAAGSSGSPAAEGSSGTGQLVEEIVLSIPEMEKAKPRGILKATN